MSRIVSPTQSTPESRLKVSKKILIDDELVEECEDRIGMSSFAWDTVNAKEIVRAILGAVGVEAQVACGRCNGTGLCRGPSIKGGIEQCERCAGKGLQE